ncbi:MAG: hypothetical protein IIX77_04525 [Oscillospiraceae bacterium]|nr:hypothetical protein [Oscillospiraceae bacterium]
MSYIVLDMEWNQAMRAEKVVTLKNGSRLVGEIIQIGAVKIDIDGNVLDRFSCHVRPKCYQKLHFKIKKLTGITQEQINNGLTFGDAVAAFLNWCGDEPVLLTWGYDDIPMLRDNMLLHDMDAKWTKNWYNIQIIFNRQTQTGDNQKALQTAMEHFGLAMDMPAHDALNDAYYTALVCSKLDMRGGMEDYPLMSIDEADAVFCKTKQYTGYRGVRGVFDSYKKGKTLYCPDCGCAVKAKPFVRQGANKIIAMCRCEACGGEYLYQLKAKKLQDEIYRLALLIFPLTERMRTLYKQKVQDEKDRAQKMLERAKMAEEE